MTRPYHYRLFGLGLHSDIVLPELRTDEDPDLPDVIIEQGIIPSGYDPSVEFASDETGACLSIGGVARYWIRGGTRIMVEPAAGTPAANIRLFLLGSVMGVLLHQRGLLPLHANAVKIDGTAVAFMGSSGAGKSTLAAAFHDRGYRIVADDVCVIRFDDGRAFACPGIPRLRLWEETLAATGRSSTAFELSYVGDDSYRKFDVPIALEEANAEAVPLAAVVDLTDGASLDLQRITGSAAAELIFAHTYRGAFVRLAGNPHAHWSAALNLVQTTPIFRLSRPRNPARLAADLDDVVRLVTRMFAQNRHGN